MRKQRLMTMAIVLTLSLFGTASYAQYSSNQPLPHPYPTGKVHRLFPADAPPGVIGAARLQRWGSVAGHYQAVAIRGPETTQFSLPIDGVFQPPSEQPLCAGMLIGAVYRFRITSIPDHDGEELYPTIEVIDRTYPPESLAARFPITVNLDMVDIEEALAGRLVTRVIYLEDPMNAVPLPETPKTSRVLDIPGNQDPVEVADQLGKPVAIVRIGSVAPPNSESLMPQFFLGYPPWVPAVMQPMESVNQSIDGANATVGDLDPSIVGEPIGTPVDALESPSDQVPGARFETSAESATR